MSFPWANHYEPKAPLMKWLAPAAVAATVEPVVGTILALVLFAQALTPGGWAGLAIVVLAVSGGYLLEARMARGERRPRDRGADPGRA